MSRAVAAPDVEKDWAAATKNFAALEANHKQFLEIRTKTFQLEADNKAAMSKAKKEMKTIAEDLKASTLSADAKSEIVREMSERGKTLSSMGKLYPAPLSVLLTAILGSVNVTVPVKDDRFKYKVEYEAYKLRMTFVIIVNALLCMIFQIKFLDSIFQAVLVWFYMTITLREHVLIVNGSKIMHWWLVHHYLAILLSCIILTWPDTESYHTFRTKFMAFSLFLAAVQIFQFKYQSGILYKKRALGQSETMETTTDVATPSLFYWILLCLLVLYVAQLSIAGFLIKHYWDAEGDTEWQVLSAGLIFLTHGIGNLQGLVKVLIGKAAKLAAPKQS
eukprot:m.362053 g.362053  ORF g.362053 m.362053 type:complete len:333 (-) comp56012_c0_seq1:130-1128(-)